MSARTAVIFVIGLLVSLTVGGLAIWRGNLALKASQTVQEPTSEPTFNLSDTRVAIPEFTSIAQTPLLEDSDFSLSVKVSKNSPENLKDLAILIGARGIRTEDMPTTTFKLAGKSWYSGVDWYILDRRPIGILGDTPWQNSYNKKIKQIVKQELDDEGRAPLFLAVLPISKLEDSSISEDQVNFVDRFVDSPFLKTSSPKTDLQVVSSSEKLRNEQGDLYSISKPELPPGTPGDFLQKRVAVGNVISYTISIRNTTLAKDIDLKLRPVGFQAEILSFDLPPAPYELLDETFKPDQILAGAELKPFSIRKRLEESGRAGDNLTFKLVVKVKGFSNYTAWQKITEGNSSKIVGFISLLVRVAPTNSDNLEELYYQTGLKYRVEGLQAQISN